MVNTGAEIGLFGIGVKTPEARIIENQHKQNAMMAQTMKNQEMGIRADGMTYQELQQTRQSTEHGLSRVDGILTQRIDQMDSTLNQGFRQYVPRPVSH
ncbi:MAG: hypothetical protein A2277_18795 [Desulfobacterales bacterium RIFOXYA12_FULL_46_15]|nr:MAG: hypothetical protein A2097_12610 [Desulfobacula sp. GWF2_41_7]OGR22670.1 MAG: hypothetical protein A2277_18795 [Desulfobacterales bacterium RIFOXYA12_FULL_46_15]